MTDLADGAPYVGLRPFATDEAPFYFGRTSLSHALVAEWLDNPVVVLQGPPQTGKSSLLRAGALPWLVDADADVLPVGRVPRAAARVGGRALLPRQAGNPYIASLLRDWEVRPDEFASLTDAVRARAGRARPLSSDRPVLIALDQIEDLVADDSTHLQPLREQFAEQLRNLIDSLPNVRLLLVARSAHRGDLAQFEASVSGGSLIPTVEIGRLDTRAALAAIVEPMRVRGRKLAPGVVEAIIDDLVTSQVVDATGNPATLVTNSVSPAHVQLVATALWRAMPAAADTYVVTSADVDLDVDQVIAAHLTQVIVDVAEQHCLGDGEVRAWLTRTFVTERGRRGSADLGMSTTAGMPNTLLDALVDRHVLTSEWRSGSWRYELVEDRLIPPLQRAFPDWAVAGRAAAEAGPDDYVQAALVNLADGDVTLAQTHVAEALRRSDARSRSRADAEVVSARIDEMRDRYDDAERRYREAAEQYESLPDTDASGHALAAVGRLSLRRGLYGRAVEDLQAAAARLPADLDVQVDLARALWFSGQPWAAAAVFSSVLTINPDAANALSVRGQLRLELGDDASALDDLEGSLRLAPEIGRRPEVRAARALALARLGHLDGASAEAAAAIADAPNSGPVLMWAAGVARLVGEVDRAEDLLNRIWDAHEPALAPYRLQQVHRVLGRPGAMA